MQKIEYIDTRLLNPHPENPRTITEKQFDKLCESIKNNPDYFETRPILCNPEMIIFAGNMRYKAAVELGMDKVPTAVMDISEAKQRELMIRDNKENGRFDYEVLANTFELQELEAYGFEKPELTGVEAFQVEEQTNTKEPKTITCPNCGEEFEL